jgi:hypothetical protein
VEQWALHHHQPGAHAFSLHLHVHFVEKLQYRIPQFVFKLALKATSHQFRIARQVMWFDRPRMEHVTLDYYNFLYLTCNFYEALEILK